MTTGQWEIKAGDEKREREQKEVLRGVCLMQCFWENTCCSLSEGVEEAAVVSLPETPVHIPFSEPHVRLLSGVKQHLCWFE